MDELLPKHPHNAIICGRTNSGKTYHTLNLIEKYYLHAFAHIFIICPTYHDNKTYDRTRRPWLSRCTVVANGDLVDNLEALIKRHSKGGQLSGKKSLIIIDDCSAEKDLNKHRTSLSKIAFSGRHANLTTWFITQRYVSAPKDFRENIHWILVTKNTCKKSFETLTSENDIIPSEHHAEIKAGLVNSFMLFVNTDRGEYLILNK
jgi:hypothetical protein